MLKKKHFYVQGWGVYLEEVHLYGKASVRPQTVQSKEVFIHKRFNLTCFILHSKIELSNNSMFSSFLIPLSYKNNITFTYTHLLIKNF